MCAAVVAGVDAPPVFQPAEHVLDLVPLAMERAVVRDGDFAVGLRRDARGDASLDVRVAEPVGVIATVAEQDLGFWNASIIKAAPL